MLDLTAPKSAKAVPTAPPHLQRLTALRDAFDALAPKRGEWLARNRYFYETDHAYMRFMIPQGMRVLEIGCGDGQLLGALRPSYGVGIDLSPAMIEVAQKKNPDLEFHVADAEDGRTMSGLKGPFDFIVLSDIIGYIDDCEELLRNIRNVTTPDTRIVIAYYSRTWEPILAVAELLRQKMPSSKQSWISTEDIINLLELSDYEVIRREWRLLIPKSLFGLGAFINRYIAPLPGIRRLSLRNYVVARPLETPLTPTKWPSVSIVVPCRNESGNIANLVPRVPEFPGELELIFVEGHSKDDTYATCEKVRDAYPQMDIKVFRQEGKGKGDAVRKGFDAARGDILMILDADLTVPPETLLKFYRPIATGNAEFVNGTRLVYPIGDKAMQFLNRIANRCFALLFTFLLNQRFTDTLCGTKVLWRRDYRRIAENRAYFGDFDPFGDFDLIFGAARLNLKISEVPVRYRARMYGETQISRFQHGWLLLRMVVFAWRKLKAI